MAGARECCFCRISMTGFALILLISMVKNCLSSRLLDERVAACLLECREPRAIGARAVGRGGGRTCLFPDRIDHRARGVRKCLVLRSGPPWVGFATAGLVRPSCDLSAPSEKDRGSMDQKKRE